MVIQLLQNETQRQCLRTSFPTLLRFSQNGNLSVVEKSSQPSPKVRRGVRAYGYVITKISWMHRLPKFVKYGAPFARSSRSRGTIFFKFDKNGAPLLLFCHRDNRPI